MGLGMLLFLALIVVGIVLLLRPAVGSEPRRERNRALEILDERFARGEIDREEYEERRRVLESGRS
jgi:putative membrane protein